MVSRLRIQRRHDKNLRDALLKVISQLFDELRIRFKCQKNFFWADGVAGILALIISTIITNYYQFRIDAKSNKPQVKIYHEGESVYQTN